MSSNQKVIGVFTKYTSRCGYEFDYDSILELNPTFEDAWVTIGERFDSVDLPELIKRLEFLSYNEILDDHLVGIHIGIDYAGYYIDDGCDYSEVYMKKLEVRSRQ